MVAACPARVYTVHRVVIAVGIHIVPHDALTGADKPISVDEALDLGVVVPAL